MKKLTLLMFLVCLIVFSSAATGVYAAEATVNKPAVSNEPTRRGGNVTITVVLPDKTETPNVTDEPETTTESKAPETEVSTEPEGTAEPETVTPKPDTVADYLASNKAVLYPVDVAEINENGWQIVKTYELTPLDSPKDIPNGDFTRKMDGADWRFSMTDIIKRETANAETKPHKETITLNTDTKEIEKILTLLTPTIEYKTEDEFAGILTLDVASIKVESAGTKTSSYTMKATREYPRLSSADTSLVPKTITDKGKTYTLADVDWKTGNYETVDYEQLPEYYTAMATYTATGTSTSVTGYVTTAEYNGTLAKLSEGKTVYTAFFDGEEIRTALEFTPGTQNAIPTVKTDNGNTNTPSESSELISPIVPDESAEPSVTTEPTKETQEPIETSEPTATPTAEPVSEGGGTIVALYIVIAVLVAMLGGAVFCVFIILKGRGKIRNEKTDNDFADVDSHDDSGDAGFRG